MFLGSPGVCPDPLNSTRRRQLNPHDAGSSRATQSISRSHAISSSCYVVIIMFPRMSNHPWLSEAARFNYGIFLFLHDLMTMCVVYLLHIPRIGMHSIVPTSLSRHGFGSFLCRSQRISTRVSYRDTFSYVTFPLC